MAVTTKPLPLFGFSSNTKHDTWRNIKENGEFVINLVGGENFGPLVSTLERDFPYEVSEINEAGLTEVNANRLNLLELGKPSVGLNVEW